MGLAFVRFAAGAGQGDVGMVGAGLGDESATRGCGNDAAGEGDKPGSGDDIGEEDPGAIEDAQFGEMDGDGL